MNLGATVFIFGQVLPVESLAQSTHLVLPCGQEVEEGNDGALKLCASAGVDGGGAESLPDNRLADVGGDEQGNPAAKTVTLLEKLVQQQHNETGHKQLDDDQQTDTSADVTRVSVHTSQHVHNCLSNSDDHAKELLGAVEEGPVLGGVSHLDQGSSVGSQDNSDPVEGVRRV